MDPDSRNCDIRLVELSFHCSSISESLPMCSTFSLILVTTANRSPFQQS